MQQVKDSTQFMEKLDTLGNKLLLERTEIPQRTLSARKKNDWLRYNLRFANVPSFAGYRTTLVGQYGNVLQ